jgi:hypothetical protein
MSGVLIPFLLPVYPGAPHVPGRTVREMSGQAFDDLDHFFALEPVMPGKFDEFSGPGEHGSTLRGARYGDATSTSELQQAFIPEQVQRPQNGARSQFRRAQRRFDQAMLRAFPVRQGAQVTMTTATFSAIGQPQRITAPPHAVPNCAIGSQC